MSRIDEQLEHALSRLGGVNRFLVAFSGGLDSSVLLHALCRQASRRRHMAIRAVHVHHGLHADADQWTEHCRTVCATLDVDLDVFYANLDPVAGESVEAEAREARYRLLRQAMQPNDALLMAHHGDDQLETMLMRLLRGAGGRGLAGIPGQRGLSPGILLRPFIQLPRTELADYARNHGLAFLEDPGNRDLRFDRAYLREEIVAPLKQRWPAAVPNAVRTAQHLDTEQVLLDDLARLDLRRAAVASDSLSVKDLLQLSPARRSNLLRYWIRLSGYALPSSARLASIESTVLSASRDAEPVVAWKGAELRRFRDHIYIMPPLPDMPQAWCASWNTGEEFVLPAQAGRLRKLAGNGGGLDAGLFAGGNVSVAFRSGGERLRPAGSRHHKTLSRLFQEQGVVPWMRARVPLVFIDGQLAAVADLCWAEGFGAAGKGAGVRLAWDGHPPLSGF